MSWIDEVEVGDADGKLGAMYAELIEKRGKISNILKVHSLNPDAMGNHLDLYMTTMFCKSGLSRAEREGIAVVVSANNDCAYCVNHHVEALRRYIKDEETVEMLATADGLETLEPRLSNIVRHAEKRRRQRIIRTSDNRAVQRQRQPRLYRGHLLRSDGRHHSRFGRLTSCSAENSTAHNSVVGRACVNRS